MNIAQNTPTAAAAANTAVHTLARGLAHLTHFYDLRDAHDQQIGFGRASGPTMARIKAERAGATFFVDEF